MKHILMLIAASTLLAACANTGDRPAPRKLTAAEAISACAESSGTQDRALFDACMHDKGYQRKNAAADAITQ
ncbi:hypothetical protein [Bergeriella denitrificans]|uniref:Lipoprotein n=1 Tax=Bergeriella denitrificans TaxID=494 RepID=A0A378UFI3_BERDE|nr:hypothetical protein [Bergeriella denitrificans]STZ75503.1 Uncharacterised protein [Bergeriella denitrificans]